MGSIIGQLVKGDLGRENTAFVGIVVEEYRVQDGPLTGLPMVKVDTTDNRTVYAIRGEVDIVPDDESVPEVPLANIASASLEIEKGSAVRHLIRSVGLLFAGAVLFILSGVVTGYLAAEAPAPAPVVYCPTEDSCTPHYIGELDRWVITQDTP